MFKANLKLHHRIVDCKKTTRIAALVFFLFLPILPSLGQTNQVSGQAYGTNYVVLATKKSIASTADGAGSLNIGYTGTTNISLNHNISGFIVIDNQTTNFVIAASADAMVTSSAGPALSVLNATNLHLSGGRYVGKLSTGAGSYPPIPGADGTVAGGLLRNSTDIVIDSSEFTGASGFAGMVVQASELEVSNGIFIGGAGAEGLLAVSNSVVTINSGSFSGQVGMAVQTSELVVNDGTFSGSSGGAGLLAVSNSVVTINDGTFTGGKNAAALHARNSDLTINGGTFQGGSFETNSYFGLVSIADATRTNNIALNGGTFNSIDFAGAGVQMVTTETNLQVDGVIVLDGGTLIVDNASSTPFQNLWIRSGDMALLNSYTLSADGNLQFQIVSNSYGQLSAPSIGIESNATIHVDATLASFDTGITNILLVSATNGIISLNTTNLTASTIGRVLLTDAYVDGTGSNLLFEFTTQALKDYWNATGAFGDFADELESLLTPEMNTAINLIDDPEISSRAVEQTYFTTFNSFQTAVQGMRAAVGQSVARGTHLRDERKLKPLGARGPAAQQGQAESHIRGWGKYYGNYYTRSEAGLYPSYESGLHGGILGIDTSIGNLIVGISGGASRYETVFDNNEARENTTATHGNLYGSYGAERGYIDAGIAYGQNKVKTRTADPFRLDGDFEAQLANVYLGGGYDLVDTRGGTVFTPEIAVQYAKYKQDAYSETGTAAVPRVFDEFDADSLLGSIGINIAMQEKKAMKTFAFQMDGRLHWMHEFNPDPSNINFMLAGGSNPYQLDYPSLDEEIYRIGVGCSFFNTGRQKPQNVVFRVDFDELFGDGFNSHNLSAKVIYAF